MLPFINVSVEQVPEGVVVNVSNDNSDNVETIDYSKTTIEKIIEGKDDFIQKDETDLVKLNHKKTDDGNRVECTL